MRAELRAKGLAVSRGETVCRGIWGSGGSAFALGKIYFLFNGKSAWSEGDILCVFDGFEYTQGPMPTPAGVIMSAEAVCPELLGFLSKSGIPYLILKEPFSLDCVGKVALLDTERDMLIIDPSIDTLNDYAMMKKAVGQRTAELLALSEKADKIIKGKKRGEILVTPCIEGDMFDMLSGLAERFCSLPITVSLSVPLTSGERDSFCDAAEAVFRAAVFGNFSVMLGGYKSSEDIVSALSLMHRSFCALEEGGREFNGYLCRGLIIDTPIWLSRFMPFPKADFLCFDLDRITSLLLGRDASDTDGVDAAEEMLLSVWKNYFSRFAPSCPIKAKSKLLSTSEFLRKWSELAYIDELYLE